MKNIEWGEFSFKDIFNEITQGKRLKKDDQILGGIPFIMAGTTNSGLVNFISNPPVIFPENSITIDIFGNTFYRDYSFGAGDDTGVYWSTEKQYSSATMKFFAIAMSKAVHQKFDFGKKLRSSQSLNFKMQLPTENGKIDFHFMESFIADLELERILKLESYLSEVGLNDYELTEKEKKALESFESGTNLQNFRFGKIFNKIKQGKRLKKDDQVSGKTPFVMSGVTDTGVVNWISNPVQIFPKNSITIDIFGNTFYRNYSYGAGDDTGVYWNDEIKYSREVMIFFASAMTKSVSGKFDYGRKLRSSQSSDFEMMLPVKDSKPDYETMEAVVSAIHKLVIKDVVLYVERKKTELSFAATQEFQ